MDFFCRSLDEHHDVTVSLFRFLETFLLDHLSVINEANELPITQVNQPLRHVVRHVNDSYLFISRCKRLISEEWVVDDPGLSNGLLMVK